MRIVSKKVGFDRVVNECSFPVSVQFSDLAGKELLSTAIPESTGNYPDQSSVWSGVQLEPLYDVIDRVSPESPLEIFLFNRNERLQATYRVYANPHKATDLQLFFLHPSSGREFPVELQGNEIRLRKVSWEGAVTIGLGTLDIDGILRNVPNDRQDTTRIE